MSVWKGGQDLLCKTEQEGSLGGYEYANLTWGWNRRVRDAGGGGAAPRAISGKLTLVATDAKHQVVTPTGAQDVELPAFQAGLEFIIRNAGVSTLTVKNAGGSTILSLTAGNVGYFNCSATVWYGSLLVAAGAADCYIDGGAANDNIWFGYNTDTDVFLCGATNTDQVQWIAATATLTLTANCQLVITGGSGAGHVGDGLVIAHGDGAPDGTVVGSIYFEQDAKKLWVRNTAGWEMVVVA
jgi:hypothetical protein